MYKNVEQPLVFNFRRPGSAWVFWLLGTLVVGVLAWATLMVIAGLTWGLVLPIAPGILAGSVGGVQWLVLRPRVHGAMQLWIELRWALLSALGATIAWLGIIALRMLASTIDPQLADHPLFSVIGFLLGGLVFGFVQWQTWDNKDVRSTTWWAIVNGVAWSLGGYIGLNVARMVVTFLVPNQVTPTLFGFVEALHFFIAGVIVISIYAATTSIALATGERFRKVTPSVLAGGEPSHVKGP